MGDEADYLESQCDGGAARDMAIWEREQREAARRKRAALKAEVARQLKAAGIVPQPPRGKMVDCVCVSCQTPFKAREADRKRGWAKSCSKSCAAKNKDKTTGGRNREHYGY